MRTRILKKESSSRALPLVAILISLTSMAQNCRAMETVDQGEEKPLLKKDDSLIINGTSGTREENGDQSDVVVQTDLTLVNIDVPQKLITMPDSTEAVKGMEAMNRRVRYDEIVACEAEETKEGQEFFEKVVLLKICNDREDIPDTLLDLALAAGKENGPVQTYFNETKAQVNDAIEKINELKKQNNDLKGVIFTERDEARTEINRLNQMVKYLCIGLPVAVGCTGLLVWGIIWYFGGEK